MREPAARGNGAAGVGVSSPSVKNVREDPARNAEVWNGRVSRELGKGDAPDPELIQSAVSDQLKEFPARGHRSSRPSWFGPSTWSLLLIINHNIHYA